MNKTTLIANGKENKQILNQTVQFRGRTYRSTTVDKPANNNIIKNNLNNTTRNPNNLNVQIPAKNKINSNPRRYKDNK